MLASIATSWATLLSLPFAEPAAVGNLIVTDVTTSSVSLSWAQPEGKVTWYIVRWAGGEDTTTETSFVIRNLTPGSQYNISVAAVAGVASNEGDGGSAVTFTRKFRPTSDLESSPLLNTTYVWCAGPEKPGNIMLTSRGTDYLSIRWSLLKGKFQYFRVNVSEAQSGSVYYNETKANTADIIGLGPGRIFAITVSTVAGNFTEASEEYRFATCKFTIGLSSSNGPHKLTYRACGCQSPTLLVPSSAGRQTRLSRWSGRLLHWWTARQTSDTMSPTNPAAEKWKISPRLSTTQSCPIFPLELFTI